MESTSNHCGTALRVLIAEDQENTATILGILLRLHGYEVEIASDGPTALQAVQARSPDVVLLDIGLPKMNGWQVAEQIHKLSAPKRPLLIAITGYGTQADQTRSEEAGIDLHLVKPADMVALEKLLRRFQEVIFSPDQARHGGNGCEARG
jgi:CheY-like chemotaxis protein